MSQQSLEIEVKFLLADAGAFRQRLLAAGADLHRERIYERNIRFDSPWNGLALQGKLLRLRQDTSAQLTYKGEPESPVDSDARVREELEVTVSSFEVMSAILERVGFEEKEIYEKYRETFTLGEVEIVLDELPFGNFVELEGPETAIRQAASDLDLDWNRRILTNYLQLMAQLKSHFNLPFDDLTFENFADLDLTMSELIE
jgi:adenylate cyclase class 2